jgi:hypothetical protein
MPEYSYIAIEDKQRVVAHIFVAPQEVTGLDIGYVEPDEDDEQEADALSVAGDIYIGNPEDGYYTIDFDLHQRNGTDVFSFGEEEYDLSRGRCFVVKQRYAVAQLPYQSKEEAARHLAKRKR